MDREAISQLGSDELALIKKLGIKLPVQARIKKDTPKPKSVDLSPYSAEITRKCTCCGKVTKTYADYIKRADMEGFAMRTVESPSNPIMRFHEYTVLQCKYCCDDALKEMDNVSLIDMIHNLRQRVIDVQQSQRLTKEN